MSKLGRLTTLLVSLLLVSCAIAPSKPTLPILVEPTTGQWKPDPSDDWVTVCTYTPQADVNEYIGCLITTQL